MMYYFMIFITIVLLGCHCEKAHGNYRAFANTKQQFIPMQKSNTEIFTPSSLDKDQAVVSSSVGISKKENILIVEETPLLEKEKRENQAEQQENELISEDESSETDNYNNPVVQESKKNITVKNPAKSIEKKPSKNDISENKKNEIKAKKRQKVRFSVLKFPFSKTSSVKEITLPEKQSTSQSIKKDIVKQETIAVEKDISDQEVTPVEKNILERKTVSVETNIPKQKQIDFPNKDNNAKEATTPIKKIEEKLAAPVAVKVKLLDEIVQEKFAELAGTYEYEVYVESNLSGSQKMVISPQENGSVIVKSAIKFSFRALLFFTITYEHSCEEIWQNGELQSLTTNTIKNGTKIALKLERKGKKMIGTLDGKSLTTVIPIATNNAWNLGVSFINRQKYNVINPEDGIISLLNFSQKKGLPFNLEGKKISTSYLKAKGRSWEFWFSPRNVMLKQKDVLKGYSVEIILKKMSKNN